MAVNQMERVVSTLARDSRDFSFESLVFDRLPHGALVVERSGEILSANRKARDTFEELAKARPHPGDYLEDFLSEPRPKLMEDIRSAAAGGRIGLKLSGEHSPLVVWVTAVRPRGPYILSLAGTASVEHALVGARSKLYEATRVAARERRLRRKADAEYRAMENFAMIAAHDLKQPLRNISELLSFLTEDFGETLPAEALTLVHSAQNSASRLQRLITDLLRHARVSSEPIHKMPVDIDAIVDQIEADFAPIVEETGAQILRQQPLGEVEADAQLFRLLLENLIGNAIKYRSAERAPVIALRRSADGRALEVRDNGRGFDWRGAEKMFEPFTRLVSDPAIEGTGLGLSSCRAIAQRHGWSMDAQGRLGEGATFIVRGLT